MATTLKGITMNHFLDQYLQLLDRNEHPCRKGPPERYTPPTKLLDEYLKQEGFNSWSFARQEKPL